MIELSKTYITFGIIIFFVIIYVVFLMFIHLIDYRLYTDSVYKDDHYKDEEYDVKSIPSPNNVVQQTNLIKDSIETFSNSDIKNKITKDDSIPPIDGYSTNENYIYGKYLEDTGVNVIIDDSNNRVCCINHNHDDYKCTYGTVNFPHPRTLNGIDRKIFKVNYQENMTLQDYINWLFLFTDDESALSYEHYKFYNKLKKGGSLKYIKGVCPPSARKLNKPITSNEYYTNLYDDIENSNFTKLIHESKLDITKTPDPVELNNEMRKSTEIHGKQLKGYNYLAYTRLDKYDKI